MVLPLVPVPVKADATINNFNTTNFEGLNFSLIGDSISTYTGINNSAAYNPDYYTYDGVASKVHYTEGRWGVYLNDTWWMQAVNTMGMNLLVNNAWSASATYYTKGEVEPAYMNRSAHLHKGSTNPDIIALYLGTNDCSRLTSNSELGTVNSTLITAAENYVNNGSGTVDSILKAYAVMLYRAIKTYPDAEIYCFTLLPQHDEQDAANRAAYIAFNNGLKALVDHYDDVYLVDLYNECGIDPEDTTSRTRCYGDNLHPNPQGMDAITNCLLSSMIENSKYMSGSKAYSVDYDLYDAYVSVGNVYEGATMYGDINAALPNKPFAVDIASTSGADIDVIVTMGGENITQDCVSGNSVYIERVTGDVKIIANSLSNYHVEAQEHAMVSNPELDKNFSHNYPTLSGTYAANGKFNYLSAAGAPHFKMDKTINLLHNRPWVLEVRIGGISESTYGGFQGGILLFSETEASTTEGNMYIHLSQSQFLIGNRTTAYNNSGYGWDQIAAKVGSSAGDAFRNAPHTYRLENKIDASNGQNMIYLTVDGVYIGAMDAGEANNATFVGKDLNFNYIGTTEFPLQATELIYCKFYENGEPTEDENLTFNYRWSGVESELTTAPSEGYFTENTATVVAGSSVNGVQTDAYHKLDRTVRLVHDNAWAVEWRAKGDWYAAGGDDPMIFSTSSNGNHYMAPYIWRNSNSFLAIGVGEQGGFSNYGVNFASMALSDDAFYTYRITNKITYNTDGTYAGNMPYLSIDGIEVGPFDSYFVNGNVDQATASTWLSGKDFTFDYLGNARFPMRDITVDYIQVWENGVSGSADTTRLEYLYNNRLGTRSDYDWDAWIAYSDACDAAWEIINGEDVTQEDVDAAIDELIRTRNELILTDDTTTTIYHAELITGDYARVGQQTGIRVITTPDVAQLCIGTQKLLTCTSDIQEMYVGDELMDVKVWFVSFLRTGNDEDTITYGIGAWTTYSEDHDGLRESNPDKYGFITVHYKATYPVSLAVSTMPTKTTYKVGETFDSTGLKLTATMNDGTTVDVTADAKFDVEVMTADTTYVVAAYDGATVSIPVVVEAEDSAT